jgi:hypothetical protein
MWVLHKEAIVWIALSSQDGVDNAQPAFSRYIADDPESDQGPVCLAVSPGPKLH